MTLPRRSRLTSTLAACIAAAGLAATAPAQPADGSAGSTTVPEGHQTPVQPPAPRLIDVDFPGGSVSSYCDAVRAAAKPDAVNIILDEGADHVTLPPISLKRVTSNVAMRVLSMMSPTGKSRLVGTDRLDDKGATTWVLRTRLVADTTGASPRKTTIHSLRSIVEPPPGMPNTDDVALPIDTVMAALTVAARSDEHGPDPVPELMLHRESLMLVCRGTSSQQNLIDSVLEELKDDMMNRRSMLAQRMEVTEKARLDRITSEAEVKQAQLRVAKAAADRDEALHQLDLIQKRVDSGLSPQTDLSRAQSDVSTAKANLDAAKAQFEMLQSRAAVVAERQAAMSAPPPDRTVVIYDAADFGAFKDDIMRVADALLHDGGRAQWTNNSVVATATADQHQALKAFLLTLRRVKANDPTLAPAADSVKPGLAKDPD